ncbi:hypothetical protein [Glutamicibacter sp.]|uniref:hypothetical protein n=1 Tax=Glutamicibacter sp. TaxID=1931995 RepID=UPI0028BE471A|nr:hypothetical protein [Glutamicibacter sp.]
MDADQIRQANGIRMWFIWLPVLAALVVALYFVLPLSNGLWVLVMMVFGVLCVCAVADWAAAERAAFRAEAARQG